MSSIAENSFGYCQVCLEAENNEESFSNFKRNQYYQSILEHVSFEQGLSYYESLDDIFKEKISLASLNDTIGNPITYNYKFGNFSPTTLRYVKVLNDLSKQIKLNDSSIVEIGAGYGGQYSVLRKFYTPKSYDFFDLNEVLPLIKKYISRLGLNDIDISFENQHNRIKIRENYDLLISNYAISECDIVTQDYYLDNIVKISNHGYITFNHMNGYQLSDFLNLLKKHNKNYSCFQEKPQTSSNNVLITW